jgi:hypothetical protein
MKMVQIPNGQGAEGTVRRDNVDGEKKYWIC